MQILLSRPCNLILFNLIWLACVLGRDRLVVPVSLLVLGYLSLLVYHRRLRLEQLLIPATIGVAADLLMTLAGLFDFGDAPLIVPVWLITLWLAFSSTLNLSLAAVGRKKWLAALAGALAFPLNYSLGERLGAVNFGGPDFAAPLALAITWAMLLPLLFVITEQHREKVCATN